MRGTTALLAAALLTLVAACDKGTKTEATPPVAATAAAAVGVVEVPAEGKKLDPPIKPEQLPASAWYCDMGTVHWAQMKEGDKTCPLCKMTLTQKPAK